MEEGLGRVKVAISLKQESKILWHFFQGMPQPRIAKKTVANQATVSRCVSRLKDRA
ncbi:hypothetical protein ES703_37300 [subsurface metagenome]